MPNQSNHHRIRLKLPGGAELEAEGSPEFVYKERQEFMDRLHGGGTQDPGEAAGAFISNAPNISWETIMEIKGHNIQLRTKLRGDKSEKDACLVLLAASQKLLSQPKPTSAQLAKWMRSSGYPIQRMDRVLQDAIDQGELLSSGSRRARRYELTAPGRLKAYILANQLTGIVTGRS